MKIARIDDLKNPNYTAPFYSVIDGNKLGTQDPRACGCATLAILNAVLVLKSRLEISDDKTAFDEMVQIQELTQENENSVRPENFFRFIDNHPVFNSCRMLVLNPNGMDEEIFLRIFLNRLAQGNIAFALLEIPKKNGDQALNIINHASFIHSENGEVYYDGLRVDLNFLIRTLYFSRPNTLLFLAPNEGATHER